MSMPSASTINLLTGGAMHGYKALVDGADPAALSQFATTLMDFGRRLTELSSQFHQSQQGMEEQWVPLERSGPEDGQDGQAQQPDWFEQRMASLTGAALRMGSPER